MDCAINSAAAEKRRVGRVHNGINVELRDVAAENFDFPAHLISVGLVLYPQCKLK
jgi:hypothetical protein